MDQPGGQTANRQLTWLVCPEAQLRSASWLRRARASGYRAVATPWSRWQGDVAAVAAWAESVRGERLVAAVLVTASELDTLPAADLDAGGPLLLGLTAAAGDTPSGWQAARARLARQRTPRLRWSTAGLPPCHLGAWQPDIELAPPIRRRDQQHGCERCARRVDCVGPPPAAEIAPLPEAVSNQFDLAPCPPGEAWLRVAVDTRQPALAFGVRGAERPEMREAMVRGQIYLDRSDKPRLDDFAADLALLLPGPDGFWQIAPSQPFAAEEALLLAHLRALRGVVVDVGAGPVRYVEELAPAQARGEVRYVAVEPELAALRRTVAVLPDAACLQGTGEHLPLRDGVADAVLLLRSFNHLRDVPQALREVARVLKPGGVCIACDNVAFGLCRTDAQLARAHAISVAETPFEHYRNADGPDAAAALAAAVPGGFRIDAVSAVGPGTSNQWLVRATRLA